jgi:hypothetical protein
MTAYRAFSTPQATVSAAVQAAKARRQAVLRRVRTQRAALHKRTVADWQKEGLIIRASELKERQSVQ